MKEEVRSSCFEQAFSVQCFGCRTFKCGVALAHVTYSTIQIKCESFQNKVSFVVAMCCVIFCNIYNSVS